ncbi:AraC family transcriptional regulator [Shewanella alkalitolerans]|uniref:AraC family transcriptional regulator n=1 Tax=Shewanella alkalitolerans TaxID=2864209 RepID=UPI001C65CFCD|nr:AraC family transcriptional regulator [Shewanella alkalitolerans]QYJ99238.1 AraC family transcriptional regulator [Shewanella alkalitolerans]
MENVWEYLRSPFSIKILLDTGIELGIHPAQLMRGTGLRLEQVDDASSVISPQQEQQLIENLLQQAPDPTGLGLVVGLKHQLTTYGIFGYGMMSCANGAEALKFAKEFLPLTFTFVSMQAVIESDCVKIIFDNQKRFSPELQRFVLERAMCASSRVIGDVLGVNFHLNEFHMTYPAHDNQHLSVPDNILRAQITFNAHSNYISFGLAGLQAPLPQANPLTASMCRQLCRELSEKRHTKLHVSMLITELLKSASSNNLPMLAELADILHISERTLKRKLQAEGTSFNKILGKVKLETAERLLTSDRSLTQIAEELGFSDLSTFSQAYKRWTGIAPSKQRKILK